MNKTPIHTSKAPAAVGPYSQAIRVGNFVFTAGQTGLVPETGELAAGGISAQTEQVIKNLAAVLTEAGTSLANVIKTTVFLTTMDDFAAMNAVYARHFPEPFPGRTTVAVSALPKGGLVEIETVALVP